MAASGDDLGEGGDTPAFRVCFVCTGNICRSPMAESVLRRLALEHGLADRLHATSAGTGDWHVGERADPRTLAALAARGYDADAHRARQFERDWFDRLDLVVALDSGQDRMLRHWAPSADDRAKVALLLSFDPERPESLDVPDPYYSGAALFDSVLDTVERATAALFAQLEPGIRQGAP